MAYERLRKVTKEQLQEIADRCFSIAGMIKELGYKEQHGSSYHVVKKHLQLHNIKTEHWKGQGWSKDEQLKDWKDYTRVAKLKPHLIKIRSHTCEICKNSTWLNNLIPLEVHHIDGDRTNNELNNLQLLCCNCHATTDFWRNKKKVVDKIANAV